MLALTIALLTGESTPDRWGVETLALIKKEFSLPNSDLLSEMINVPEKKVVAFNWGVGVMISALNAGFKYETTRDSWGSKYIKASLSYWNEAAPVAGFDVLPKNSPPDRYYDDNAWMVMSLVDTYINTNDKQFLTMAEKSLKYVFSGEDTKLGGGIYWREREKTSKNTCSNGPSAAAALAIFRITRKDSFLKDAERIYAWTRKNLRDPQDGLYWDNVNLAGKIEKTKWTYNSALMLRTAVLLYEETGKEPYKKDALEIAEQSRMRWLKESGAIADEGKFAHLLVENWILAQRVGFPFPEEDLLKIQTYVWNNVRGKNGLFGGRWDRKPADNRKRWELIDQASAARLFFQSVEQH